VSLPLAFVLLLVGLVALYYAAEFLVAGASRIAASLGISPMIIGLTIVGFATSAPEFVVSLISTVWKDSPDVALGNVIGSNTANIALIIGASALIAPLAVDRRLLKRDVPLMVGIEFLAVIFCVTGALIVRWEAGVLLAVLAVFLFLALRQARAQSRSQREAGEHVERAESLGKEAARVVGGIVGLVIGADLMVRGAVTIAEHFEVSQLVIGVTIVALGTSLPELATSVVASLRGESDISIGNIVGSNLFNTGFILGGVGLIKPIPVNAQANAFDLPVMLAVAFLLVALLAFGTRIGRVKATLLLAIYGSYVFATWLVSTERLSIPTLPWL
jgi:cation:H+ antiporter